MVHFALLQQYGADYFIDAQDVEWKWQVTTTKAVSREYGDVESYISRAEG